MASYSKKILYLFFCGSLLSGVPGFSQEAKETVETIRDTVITAPDAAITDTENEEAASFKPVEEFEKENTTLRTVPDSFINLLRKDADFSYVKTGLEQDKEKTERKNNQSRSSWYGFFSVLPYIAIAVFVVLLVWYLTANNFILFRKKSIALQVPAEQDDHQDIFSINYTTAVQEALQQRNYRLAIRLQYLELLKKLSDKQLIHFLPDKTNFEYLVQMRSSNFYNDFFTATRNYEYSWYGLFDISENMYQKINGTFQQLKQKL